VCYYAFLHAFDVTHQIHGTCESILSPDFTATRA
jgi:hypothetical protein